MVTCLEEELVPRLEDPAVDVERDPYRPLTVELRALAAELDEALWVG